MGEDVVVRAEDSHAGGGDCLIGGGEDPLEGSDRDRGVLPGPGAFRVSAAGGDDDPAVGGLLSGDRRGGGHDLDGELPGQAAGRQMVVPGRDAVLVEGRVRAVIAGIKRNPRPVFRFEFGVVVVGRVWFRLDSGCRSPV